MATNEQIKAWTEEVITEYNQRAEIGKKVFAEKYKAMHYSNVAFHQKMPDDIIDSATRQNSDKNANKFLMPWLPIVIKQLKKEMTVNMPEFNIKGNNDEGKAIVDEFNEKIAEIFSFQAFGHKIKFGYDYGFVKGTIVEETVFTKMKEVYLDPAGEEQTLEMGGAVDFLFRDPMLVVPDPDANPADFSNTAKWCIVTKGFYTPEHIKNTYGIEVLSGASTYISSEPDIYKVEGMNLSGFEPTDANMIPVRYYYLTNGYIYTIVGDSYVVEKRVNSIRVVGKMPVNFAPLIPDPDCVFGFTFWEIIKWAVAMSSKAINQISDNNAFNNEFPLVVMKGTMLELMQLGSDDDGVKYLEVNPIGEKSNVQDLVHKFQFPEVTMGAQVMLDVGNQMINLLTGVTPASMGVQAKQMRTSAEAGIYQQAILTNSSEIVINIETALLNPMIWDVLRIFARYHGEFKFKKIDKSFLENFKNVHVANGSMLAQDRIKRQDLLGYLLQRAQMNPQLYDLKRVEEFGLKTFGEPSPQSWFRNLDQVGQGQQMLDQEAMRRAQGVMRGQQ